MAPLLSRFAFKRFQKSHEMQKEISYINENWKTPVFSSNKQVRVLLFRECDWRGRKLLFDSKVVVKRSNSASPSKKNTNSYARSNSTLNSTNSGTRPETSLFCRRNQTKNNHQPDVFEFLRSSSDEKMLGEMVFGSVAMSFCGTTMKIHTIRSPPQLMISFVFPISRPVGGKSRGFEGSGSLQNSTSEILIPSYSNPLETSISSSMAHSVPLDVPGRQDYTICYQENSYNESDSFRSTTSNGSITNSSLVYSPDSQSSSLTRSNSYNSFQRRFLRNINTNIECGLGKRSDDMSNIYDEAKLNNGRRRVKLGLTVVFSFDENKDDISNFQEFFFSHIALIEGHVNKLVEIATKPFSDRQSFLKALYEGTGIFQTAIQDLYTSSRLAHPLWLSMVSPSSNHHLQCRKFMAEFLCLIRQFDTKQTHFFVSTLLTSVLTHHLSWVSTVTPTEGSSTHNFQRKEAANWLDLLAKSHPYNPLWMQLGDLYGAVGFPTKIARTIVQGKHSDVVMKFLYVLSYFIRCSDVYEKIDEDRTPSDYIDEAVVLSNSDEIHGVITVEQQPCVFSQNSNHDTNNYNSSSVPKSCLCYGCGALKINGIRNATALGIKPTQSTAHVNNGAIINNEVRFTLGDDTPILIHHVEKYSKQSSLNEIREHSEQGGGDSLGYGSFNEDCRVAAENCDKFHRGAGVESNNWRPTNHNTMLQSVPELHVTLFEDNGYSKEWELSQNEAVQSEHKLTQNEQILMQNELVLGQNKHLLGQHKNVLVQNEHVLGQNEHLLGENEHKLMQIDLKIVQNEQKLVQNDHELVQNEHKLVQKLVQEEIEQNKHVLVPNEDVLVQHEHELEQNKLALVQNEYKRLNQSKLYIQEYNHLRFNDDSNHAAVANNVTIGSETMQNMAESSTNITTSTITTTSGSSCDSSNNSGVESSKENSESDAGPEEGYQSMEDIKSCEMKSLGNMMQSVFNKCLPSGTKELIMPRVQLKEVEEAESFPSGLGWSLLAGVSDHYLSDFCLQGVVGAISEDKMYEDLSASTQASVLGEPVSSAICILANTDSWSVKLCTSFASEGNNQKVSASMSPLVAGICDTLLQMSQLNMSAEFCLMHLEDRLQELYFRSQSLACMLLHSPDSSSVILDPFISLSNAVSLLGIDMHDLPLLISVASTHTPQMSKFNF